MVKTRYQASTNLQPLLEALIKKELVDSASTQALFDTIVKQIDVDLELTENTVSKQHLIQVLDLLRLLKLDSQSICAYFIYYATRQHIEVAMDDIDSKAIKLLVSELKQLDQLEIIHVKTVDAASAEGLRRLLLALVKDVRVVLLKLADHLVTLRALAYAEHAIKEQFAKVTSIVHAPLANRLGVWQLKWELEDLAFRYLQPRTYKQIAKLLDERRGDRERYIHEVIERLTQELKKEGIQADVAGRPKHIYSIWRKMHRKNLDFAEIYDVRAVRILVDSITDCYATLGIVHGLWQHIPKEFDDYIAIPKGNNYQSLHTAVVGPLAQPLEIQIRTYDMHEHAELGVAAHWRYKEGGGKDPSFDRKILSLRQLLDNRDESVDDQMLLETFQSDSEEDRIYVLTPQGKVIDLPQGGTVLDFAYHVHTSVGHRCRGAKVNGRIVQLTYALKTGQKIEILTANKEQPSRDWLHPQSGYLKSARARQKVRQWFHRIDHEQNLEAGKEIIEKELLSTLGISVDFAKLVKKFNMQKPEALYVAVGRGEITLSQVLRSAEDLFVPKQTTFKLPKILKEKPTTKQSGDIIIEGVGNLLTQLAACCQPVAGDAIIGFITRGKGVSIHKRDCSNMAHLIAEENPRLIQVSWANANLQNYTASIDIEALDRKNLLQDISTIISNAKAHITELQSKVDPDIGKAQLKISLRVNDIEHLSVIIARLTDLPNILQVSRKT